MSVLRDHQRKVQERRLHESELLIPPSNQDAERAVLGAVLLDNKCLGRATGARLVPDDFYSEQHARIFSEMVAMEKCGIPIDAITLTERLGENIDRLGGPAYLGVLAAAAGNMANLDSYLSIVREKAELRNFILMTREMGARAYQTSMNGEEFLDGVEREFFAFSEKRTPGRFTNLDDITSSTVALIRERAKNPRACIGTPTGFERLDFELAGLNPTDLIIVAARPAMGKTAFGLNLAFNGAQADPTKICAFFSLEMDRTMLGIRLLSSVTGIDARKLQRGDVTQDQIADVVEQAAAIKSSGLYIDDSSYQTVSSIAAKCRRLARVGVGGGDDQRKLGMVVVDYLTLVSVSSAGDRRDLAVGEITWGLKKLAKELKVPVICLAQLNRQCELRTDKRPMLADLRDSGNIEQDADVILFLYRDVKYNPQTEDPDAAEVIIGKQRNGPCSTVKLTFNDACTKFENYRGTEQICI